jgi:prepilin-type N-terminal cleavage/methylation domain-containing protein
MSSSRKAFTLIELLIVICILGILMGMVMPIIGAALRRQAVAKTETLVGVCKVACEEYVGEINVYPWCKPVDVRKHMAASRPDLVEIKTRDVYLELSGQGKRNSKENYLDSVHRGMIKDLGSGRTLVDAWGHEIRFRVNLKTGRPVIWSLGPNGKDETNDGTTSDPVKEPQIYYLFTSGGNGDDRGTF